MQKNRDRRQKNSGPEQADESNQKQAIFRLLWGLTVLTTGILGITGIFIGATAFVIVGAIMDALDSVVVANMGGLISALFFAIAGTLICFIAEGSPWWFGACVGLCFESTVGGLIGYGIRLANFIERNKGNKDTKRNIKKFIRALIEAI